jgi:flagellar motor switch protein FliN/FliY
LCRSFVTLCGVPAEEGICTKLPEIITMSDLTPELAQDVITACQSGAQEIAEALARCLDGSFTLSVGESILYASATDTQWQDGPGLAIGLKFGELGFAAFLPEKTDLLPTWYSNPDSTGESKLSTLAQELSMLLVPETMMADTFAAAQVERIGEALGRSNVAEDAMLVPLTLVSGDHTGQLTVIWPLAEPDALLSEATDSEEGSDPVEAPVEGSEKDEAKQGDTAQVEDFSQLPGYSRSLLQIQVPVSVRLASKKESIHEIIELSLGSMIKFSKACDQPLHLYVGEQEVATGEAVKIGDHFGFRLSQMLMPQEHFRQAQ